MLVDGVIVLSITLEIFPCITQVRDDRSHMAHDRGEQEKRKRYLTTEKDVIFFGHGFRLVILRESQRGDRPISERESSTADKLIIRFVSLTRP